MAEIPSSLDEAEKRLVDELEAVLQLGTHQLESHNLEAAKRSVNKAARLVAALKRLGYRRHGHPRAKVMQEVAYYATWQTALGARHVIVESDFRNQQAFNILDSMKDAAIQLRHEYWNDSKYVDLVKRISAWREAAQNRCIGTTEI